MSDEEVLSGGNLNPSVVRVGDTVRRTAAEWTPAVHELLRHLAKVGYPAPVPTGFDDAGREVLSFIPGVTAHANGLSALADLKGLGRAAQLVAAYHDAQASFVPPADATWCGVGRDPSGSEEVLAHNDFAPWNLIVGPRWVFIDWDLVAPGRRYWDLAWALQTVVGLWPDSANTVGDIVARIAVFLEATRVPAKDRGNVLRLVVDRTAFCAAELRRRSSQGQPQYQRLVSEGHADSWERASRYVDEQRHRWTRLLDRTY